MTKTKPILFAKHATKLSKLKIANSRKQTKIIILAF